jgi:hypothetical protein
MASDRHEWIERGLMHMVAGTLLGVFAATLAVSVGTSESAIPLIIAAVALAGAATPTLLP